MGWRRHWIIRLIENERRSHFKRVEIKCVDRGEDGETSDYNYEAGRRRERSYTLLLLFLLLLLLLLLMMMMIMSNAN